METNVAWDAIANNKSAHKLVRNKSDKRDTKQVVTGKGNLLITRRILGLGSEWQRSWVEGMVRAGGDSLAPCRGKVWNKSR